jgi:hypothetical protein
VGGTVLEVEEEVGRVESFEEEKKSDRCTAEEVAILAEQISEEGYRKIQGVKVYSVGSWKKFGSQSEREKGERACKKLHFEEVRRIKSSLQSFGLNCRRVNMAT